MRLNSAPPARRADPLRPWRAAASDDQVTSLCCRGGARQPALRRAVQSSRAAKTETATRAGCRQICRRSRGVDVGVGRRNAPTFEALPRGIITGRALGMYLSKHQGTIAGGEPGERVTVVLGLDIKGRAWRAWLENLPGRLAHEPCDRRSCRRWFVALARGFAGRGQ
jgi:hypothetical protein